MKLSSYQKTQPSRSRIVLIVLASLIAALILLDLSPFGGNYRMYTAWIQCGKKPVAAYNAFGDKLYYSPSLYSPFQLFQPTSYYCSSDEAEAAGYRASLSYQTNPSQDQ